MAHNLADIYPQVTGADLQELVNYNAFLDRVIDDKSNEILPNSDENHASLLMSKMFDNTSHQFFMVVGSFDGSISNKENYIDSLRACLGKKDMVGKVLVLEPPNEDSKGYQMLKSSSQVTIRTANSEA